MSAEERSEARRGVLVLIGGDEDKKNGKEILTRVVEVNGARRIVVIPTASNFPDRLGKTYVDAFLSLGVPTVTVLNIRGRDEAARTGHLEAVAAADAVFFTGGDQIRLVETLEGTALMDLVRERHRLGMTVAGTSAGAAAAGEITIYEGNDEGYVKGTVLHARGFGFLKGITVDTHFLERRRISRLTQQIASGRAAFGIGIAEDTAVVISPDETLEVAGTGIVTVLNGNTIRYSNYDEIQKYGTITVDGIRMSYLAAGTHFDLKSWKVLQVQVPEGECRVRRNGFLERVSRLLS